jgi:hypothetical protein
MATGSYYKLSRVIPIRKVPASPLIGPRPNLWERAHRLSMLRESRLYTTQYGNSSSNRQLYCMRFNKIFAIFVREGIRGVVSGLFFNARATLSD